MGVTLRIPGFEPIHYIASEWPQPQGLAAFFLLYGSQAAAIINQVDPETPGTVTGTPTYDADSATLSQNNWIDTNVGGSTEDLTLVSVCKLPASGDHMYIGNYNSGTPTGDQIFANLSSNTVRASGAGGTGASNTSITTVGLGTDWFLLAGVWTAAATKVYKGHAGVITSNSSGGDRSPLSSDDFRIGRGVTAFTTQPAEHMLAGIWHRALSDADIADVFAWCQAHAEALGITDLTS